MTLWLTRVANVLIFTFCCYQAAGVVNQVAANALEPSSDAPIEMPAVAAVAPVGWSERKVIVDRNLFESSLDALEIVEEEPPPEDLSETKLPIKLLGTLASNDPAIASAAIENTSQRKSRVYRIGELLDGFKGVSLRGVERKRVIILNGKKREELALEDDAPNQLALAPRPARRPSRRLRRAPGRGAGSRLAERLQEIQTKGGGRTAAELFSQAKIVPKYDDGVMVGVELNSIVEDSLYEKLGLQDGDVITELNGIEINNAGASAKALQALAEDDEISVTVGGEERTFTAEELEALLP